MNLILSFIALFLAIGGLCNSVSKKESSMWMWIWSGILTYDLYVIAGEIIKAIREI